jgi:hypothetical protein
LYPEKKWLQVTKARSRWLMMIMFKHNNLQVLSRIPGLLRKLIFLVAIFCFTACGEKFAIEFASEIYDFGTVDEGVIVEYIYSFKNKGSKTFTITDVRPDCGCTAIENWDKTVAPGKDGKITIVFKSSGFQGEVTKSITLKTNIAQRRSIQLMIKGKVLSAIEIIPRNIQLEKIPGNNNPMSGYFKILNHADSPLMIKEIIPSDLNVKAELTVIETNKQYAVKFTVDTSLDNGDDSSGYFIIINTNNEILTIRPAYTVFVPVHVYPTSVSLDTAQLAANRMEQSINIRSSMDIPVEILDPELSANGLSYAIIEVKKGEFYQITVTFPAGYKFPRDKKVTLNFRVKNDPTGMVYTVYFIPANGDSL